MFKILFCFCYLFQSLIEYEENVDITLIDLERETKGNPKCCFKWLILVDDLLEWFIEDDDVAEKLVIELIIRIIAFDLHAS